MLAGVFSIVFTSIGIIEPDGIREAIAETNPLRKQTYLPFKVLFISVE